MRRELYSIILKKTTFVWRRCPRVLLVVNFPEGLLNAPSTAHGARSAATTELRRSHCCDGAAQTSSVALILRVASRRDALNEEPASFSLVVVLILISMLVVAHTPQS